MFTIHDSTQSSRYTRSLIANLLKGLMVVYIDDKLY